MTFYETLDVSASGSLLPLAMNLTKVGSGPFAAMVKKGRDPIIRCDQCLGLQCGTMWKLPIDLKNAVAMVALRLGFIF
jgi:hypothetical protein